MSELAAASAASMIGQIVGQYQLLSEIATGGMGTVFRAKHELIDRVAAVKLLRPEYSANAEIVERFFNEARAATAIRHPGIVEVLDFGFLDSGSAYLVMEFLEGETLAARLHSRSRLSEVEAAVITKGIASALGAAHAKGIIHRDLKPDNVFLVPDPDMPTGERPKVLDFGIAKLNDEGAKVNQTRTGTLMGTPAYMAPEQARAAGEIDRRADLYSLGCIVYEMLTGTTPFVAEGAGELIALQLFGQVPPLRERIPDVSREMESLVGKLLQKEPAARPQTAAEVIELLTRAIPSLTGTVAAVTPGTQRRSAVVIPGSSATSPGAGVGALGAMGSLAGTGTLPILEPQAPPRGGKLGLVAGAFTVLLVGGGVAFFALRDQGSAEPAAPAAVPQAGTGSATQPAAPPLAPPAAPTPPSAPETVTVFFQDVPSGAKIWLDGIDVHYGATGIARIKPGPQKRLLRITADGYHPSEQQVVIDVDQVAKVQLARLGTASKPSAIQMSDADPRPPRPTQGSGARGGGSTDTPTTPVLHPSDTPTGNDGPAAAPDGDKPPVDKPPPVDPPPDKPVEPKGQTIGSGSPIEPEV